MHWAGHTGANSGWGQGAQGGGHTGANREDRSACSNQCLAQISLLVILSIIVYVTNKNSSSSSSSASR